MSTPIFPENEEIQPEVQPSKIEIERKKMLESVKQWRAVVNSLTIKLQGDVKFATDIQAEAISHRQGVVEEIKTYSVKVWHSVQKMKGLTKQRFEFYATSYQVKTSGTEKVKLIEIENPDKK